MALVRRISYSKHLQGAENYRSNSERANASNKAPIAVLFGWILAKSKHLEKYGNIYRYNGADVITCKLNLMELLRPSQAEKVATGVLDQLVEERNNERPIIIHGFSAGGYMYAQVMNKLAQEEKYASVKENIKGVVFDSLVDFDGVSRGIAVASSENKLVQRSMKTLVDTYIAVSEKFSGNVYKKRSDLFHKPPVRAPSLLLYSLSDPVAISTTIDRLADMWEDQGIKVQRKVWEESPHVFHMYVHPDDYIKEVAGFVNTLNIFDTTLDGESLRAKVLSP